MSDEPLPDSPPPEPPREFVGRRGRLYALIGLIGFGSATAMMLLSVRQQQTWFGTWLFLGLMVLVLSVQVQLLVRPARVRVEGGRFCSGFPVEWQTPLENVRSLAFDDGSLTITFHAVDKVEPPGARKLLQKKSHVHLLMPGFMPDQVDEMRQVLGIAAPAPEEPGARIEAFHRALLTATP